jgi:hypothetical protein
MLNEKLNCPGLISFLLAILAMLSNDIQHMHYQCDKLESLICIGKSMFWFNLWFTSLIVEVIFSPVEVKYSYDMDIIMILTISHRCLILLDGNDWRNEVDKVYTQYFIRWPKTLNMMNLVVKSLS